LRAFHRKSNSATYRFSRLRLTLWRFGPVPPRHLACVSWEFTGDRRRHRLGAVRGMGSAIVRASSSAVQSIDRPPERERLGNRLSTKSQPPGRVGFGEAWRETMRSRPKDARAGKFVRGNLVSGYANAQALVAPATLIGKIYFPVYRSRFQPQNCGAGEVLPKLCPRPNHTDEAVSPAKEDHSVTGLFFRA
jgi:hypothetical protein